VSVPANNLPTNTWVVLDPFGNQISTAGTTTSGLQEAINAAIFNGWPLEVRGHGASRISSQSCTTNATNVVQVTTTDGLIVGAAMTGTGIPSFTKITSIDSLTQIHISNAATTSTTATFAFNVNNIFINCSTGISVPPVEQWTARFYDVNITFSSAVTGPCFAFDSCMIVDVGFYGGQVVGQPASPGASAYLIYFNPQTPVPLDGIITVTGSRFHFSNLAYLATGGNAIGVIGMNASAGSIDNSFFSSQELNGTGTGTTPNTENGLVVFGLSSNTSFEENIIDLADVHLCLSAGLQLGVSSANQGNIRGNTYRVGGIRPGSSAVGISTYGSFDQFHIGAITNEEASGGNILQGIAYQTGTTGNNAIVGTFSGVTTPTVDNGTGNSAWTNGTLAIGSGGQVLAGTQTGVSQATVSPRIQAVSSGVTGSIGVIRTQGAGAGGGLFALAASRGTPTSPSALLSGDGVGSVLFSGDNGASVNVQTASIVVASEGTFSSASLPSHMSFNTTSSGSATIAEALRLDSVQNTINKAGRSDQSYAYLTPASSNFAITLNASNYLTIIDTSASVTTATITMSSGPVDGTINKVVTSQIITTLTVSPSSLQTVKGAPATLAAGGRFEATYRAANTTWYI
jgi:hypothetical protein